MKLEVVFSPWCIQVRDFYILPIYRSQIGTQAILSYPSTCRNYVFLDKVFWKNFPVRK